MQEFNMKNCKVCLKLKKRILIGKFDQLNKKYHDEDGLTWNGHVCGICHRNRIKENMRKKREKVTENAEQNT